MKTRKSMRAKRKGAFRAKVLGTQARPRLTVFRSNTRMSAQLIDDEHGTTMVSVWVKGKNIEAGSKLGQDIGEKAIAAKVIAVVFDRAGFRYHGAIAAVADAARKAGLQF